MLNPKSEDEKKALEEENKEYKKISWFKLPSDESELETNQRWDKLKIKSNFNCEQLMMGKPFSSLLDDPEAFSVDPSGRIMGADGQVLGTLPIPKTKEQLEALKNGEKLPDTTAENIAAAGKVDPDDALPAVEEKPKIAEDPAKKDEDSSEESDLSDEKSD